MVDLKKETHGPGSTKGVNLVFLAYDNRVARNKESQEVTTHYLDARIHPDDRRAAGQTNLALVSKRDENSPSGYNNSARYSANQFESIKQAAGDNVTDLTDKEGTVVGKIYGVKADLLVGKEGFIANTKTVEASDLAVGPDGSGKDVRDRIFESMRESKLAREAAKAAAAPAVEEPVLVGAGAPTASADEPALG